MVQRHYNLPSLKMLATFECAARLRSFKAAAAELNVTPGAVSHQVKALERDLQVDLFTRGHRAVELTDHGQALFLALADGFTTVSKAVQQLQQARLGRSVMIGATTAVSSLWLTPLLGEFWQAHGDIMISQEVRDRPFVRPLKPDLIIEYALEKPKEPNDLLFRDELLPLAGADFDVAPDISLEELAGQPLIHLDAAETSWTSWSNWFEGMGYTGPIRSGQRVNNYSIALQLARDGGGVVLGWRNLVAPLLDRQVLRVCTRYQSIAPGAFYLVAGRAELSEPSRQFRDWVLKRV